MKRQRGQSVVEFALIAPIVFLLIFGGIYGGVMFMDYLNLSNEARTVARRIAVSTNKADAIAPYKNDNGGRTFASFYNVKMTAIFTKIDSASNTEVEVPDTNVNEAQDVKVTVDFERDNKDLPTIVYAIGFPPQSFKIVYRMQLEHH